MDVKSAFLYGKIEEEVYVCQPPGFEDPEFPDRVYKVEKKLYGLHQAPRAWYETFSTYLLDNEFQRGQIDKTLFIKRVKSDILLVQVYVDDIIFGSTKKELCTKFEKLMHKKFQMSSMGDLTFFLGLQVTQKDDGIFISQDKYVDEILKKFGFSTVKTTSIPMETSKPLMKDENAKDVDVHLYRSMNVFQVTPKVSHLHAVKRIFRYFKGQPKLGLWYYKDSPFDLEAYTDSDYPGASLDRKSITGGCQFLRSRLISWQCKKQTVVANSTTEAEYMAATIKNLVFHSKTKHIEIRHHFIKDSNEKKLIQMIKIHKDQNVADLLTKAFDLNAVVTETTRRETEERHLRFLNPSGSTKPIIDEAANEEHVPTHSNYPLLSDKDRLQLKELLELCTKLSERVLDLENTKTSQAAEITKLKERAKKLERRNKLSTPRLKRLRKVGRTARIESSEDEEVTLVDEAQGRNDDNLMFDTGVFDEQEVEVEIAVRLQAQEQKRQDSGLFIERDAEVALRLQAELDEELRVERERQEEASKVAIAEMFDEVQARIDADYELAARMTQEEQEKYTIEERARLLAEFFERRKKQLAAERAEAIRNKPPTKTQLRNLMMTYLKNMGGYKHSQLKGKSYEEIQGLYERQQKRIQDFTPMDSEKEAQKPGKRLKRVAGSYATQKSPKKPKVMKSAKDVTEEEAAEYEKEKEELRLSLKIISNDDSEVDYEPLSRKFPIVNWEYQLLGKMEAKDMYVYKLTRADGSSSYHGDTQAFLRRLDRQDLNDLYRLVQERFQDHPLEGHDLLLWGYLRMIFYPDEKDELWMNQLDWKLLRWKLYESYGVHTLFMDGKPMEINMLVEKKYPLIKELLEKMLNLQLEAEEESTMAFELIKFIKSLLEE
ncbi:putative ribonuclease H-like domain-containing protein [Tanacetum coccineum]